MNLQRFHLSSDPRLQHLKLCLYENALIIYVYLYLTCICSESNAYKNLSSLLVEISVWEEEI
jgi:hypothetical protein